VHVDDGAEAAKKGTSAPGIHRRLTPGPLDLVEGKSGLGYAVKVGKICDKVIEWFERTCRRILQQGLQAALHLPGEQGDTGIHGLLQLRWCLL